MIGLNVLKANFSFNVAPLTKFIHSFGFPACWNVSFTKNKQVSCINTNMLLIIELQNCSKERNDSFGFMQWKTKEMMEDKEMAEDKSEETDLWRLNSFMRCNYLSTVGQKIKGEREL